MVSFWSRHLPFICLRAYYRHVHSTIQQWNTAMLLTLYPKSLNRSISLLIGIVMQNKITITPHLSSNLSRFHANKEHQAPCVCKCVYGGGTAPVFDVMPNIHRSFIPIFRTTLGQWRSPSSLPLGVKRAYCTALCDTILSQILHTHSFEHINGRPIPVHAHLSQVNTRRQTRQSL